MKRKKKQSLNQRPEKQAVIDASKSDSDDLKLQSNELLLDVAQVEYQSELSRITTVDTKLGISLAIDTGALFLILQDWSGLRTAFSKFPDLSSIGALWISLLAPVMQVSAIVLLTISLFLLVNAVWTRNYKNIDVDHFFNTDVLKRFPSESALIFLKSYHEATLYNKKVNDGRARWHNRCLVLMLIAIVLYMFSLF